MKTNNNFLIMENEVQLKSKIQEYNKATIFLRTSIFLDCRQLMYV